MKKYGRLLQDAEDWYRSVQRAHPDKVTCTKGCRDCCLGLFDISIADAATLREGLAAAPEATRRDIVARADEIIRKLRRIRPDLRATLDGLSDEEVDAICDGLGDVECPVLGTRGECRLYEHRPLTCRLAGVPLVDVSGEIVADTGCARCTLSSADTPRLDCAAMHKRERKILTAIDPENPHATLFIAQALSAHTS